MAFILFGLAICGLLLNAGYDVPLRFTWPPLNYLAFIVCTICIPFAFVGLFFLTRQIWLRWVSTALFMLLLLPAAFQSSFAALDMLQVQREGSDPSLELVAELHEGVSTWRAYRTNGGAMTDFGIILRKETPVLPGLVFERVVYGRYHASDATLLRLSPDKARLSVEAYGDQYPAQTFDFTL